MKPRKSNPLTAAGAPKPLPSSPLWNEWAANNPQPEALSLAKVDIRPSMAGAMKAIATGARPCDIEDIDRWASDQS